MTSSIDEPAPALREAGLAVVERQPAATAAPSPLGGQSGQSLAFGCDGSQHGADDRWRRENVALTLVADAMGGPTIGRDVGAALSRGDRVIDGEATGVRRLEVGEDRQTAEMTDGDDLRRARRLPLAEPGVLHRAQDFDPAVATSASTNAGRHFGSR
jgi:hypothetical protein